jgi:hypothetical protein
MGIFDLISDVVHLFLACLPHCVSPIRNHLCCDHFARATASQAFRRPYVLLPVLPYLIALPLASYTPKSANARHCDHDRFCQDCARQHFSPQRFALCPTTFCRPD